MVRVDTRGEIGPEGSSDSETKSVPISLRVAEGVGPALGRTFGENITDEKTAWKIDALLSRLN